MKKFKVLSNRLSTARESIKKINLALIRNLYPVKIINVPKFLVGEMLTNVKQFKEELSELELILINMKKSK